MNARRQAEQRAAEATARVKAKREAEARALDPDVQARWAMALERLDAEEAGAVGEGGAATRSGGPNPAALAVEAMEAGRSGTVEEGAPLREARLAAALARRDGKAPPETDPVRRAEAAIRQDRIKALKEVSRQMGRRVDTLEFDPLNAMARGLITEGKHLRALSPTPQLGLLAVPYRNRGALISPRQLAAFSVFHGEWLASQVGVGAVDAARIRVDGGGGGDAGWRLARAADSLAAFRTMRVAVADRWRLQLVDHVVLFDQGLESFNCPSIDRVEDRKMQAGMRLSMLLAAADSIARQLWG